MENEKELRHVTAAFVKLELQKLQRIYHHAYNYASYYIFPSFVKILK